MTNRALKAFNEIANLVGAEITMDVGVGCKIGTMPAVVRVHGKDKIVVGNWIRIKEMEGADWIKVLVRAVGEDGYFQADR